MLGVVAASFLVLSTEAQAVKFEIGIGGYQGQNYEVAPNEGANCERFGTGWQVVEFLSKKVRVNIVKAKRGYRLLRNGRRTNSVGVPLLDATVRRVDETQRTNSTCDYNYDLDPPQPVPLPQKDCTTDVENDPTNITDTMDSFNFFLNGRRPDVEGGYFWLYEQGSEVIYGDPFQNCLAFAYDGGFQTAGDGFLNAVRIPRLPENLLSRRGAQWFKGKANDTFTRDLFPTGVGAYTYEGETYEDYRVGSDVVVRETVDLRLYMKRIGKRRKAP